MTHDRSAHQLNALLGFAMMLLHETMHAFFEVTCHDRLALGGPDWEPQLDQKQWYELGFEYEEWAFDQLFMEHQGVSSASLVTTSDISSGTGAGKFATVHLLAGAAAQVDTHNSKRMVIAPTNTWTLLTSKTTQAWFLTATWERIRQEGHTFLVDETNRTEVEYLWAKPKSADWNDCVGVQLLYDGEPYRKVVFKGTADGASAIVLANEHPGPEAWAYSDNLRSTTSQTDDKYGAFLKVAGLRKR